MRKTKVGEIIQCLFRAYYDDKITKRELDRYLRWYVDHNEVDEEIEVGNFITYIEAAGGVLNYN